MLTKISQYVPRIIFQLYQRRLHDKNAAIEEDELITALNTIDLKIQFLEFKLDRLRDEQTMLKRLVEKKSLYWDGDNVPKP